VFVGIVVELLVGIPVGSTNTVGGNTVLSELGVREPKALAVCFALHAAICSSVHPPF